MQDDLERVVARDEAAETKRLNAMRTPIHPLVWIMLGVGLMIFGLLMFEVVRR